tara:strand:+ start:2430 stop:3392 length:963 start_codon:yes stop_codon:yes gene_type:complete
MANGQKQQSGVVNQQSALNQPQNPEQDVLQEIQQQPEQPEQPKQKPQYNNIYQAISNSTPQQLMEMKGFAAKRQGRREIVRNVGSERGAKLIELVNSGEMSLKQALARSKSELTPNMKKIDNLYFNDAPIEDYTIMRTRHGDNWTEAERNLWLQRKNAKLNKDEAAQEKLSASEKKQNENNVYKRKAQSDYNYLYGQFKIPSQFFKVTSEYNNATNGLTELMYQDVAETNVSRADLNSKAMEVAKTIPIGYLRNRKILLIGEDYYDMPTESENDDALRTAYAEGLISQIGKARDHLANLDNRPIEEFEIQESESKPKIDF